MDATLAIACGPIVTTWDISKYNDGTAGSNYIVAKDSGVVGVRQCRPHGDCAISDLGSSHNGQVIATCSMSTGPNNNRNNHNHHNNNKDNAHNVSLTLVESMKTFESFSNFHKDTTNQNDDPAHDCHHHHRTHPPPPRYTQTPLATSIAFGGQIARSRYLCVGDAEGAVSVWDMKKNTRSRCFRLTSSSYPSESTTGTMCSKACMDPTDTYVAALSGSHSPAVRLELYLLRDKRGVAGPSVTMVKDGRKIGVSYGGAECFQFSSLVKERVAVGARNGALLLWDISGTLTSTIKKAHKGAIIDLSFSPTDPKLIASCSTDGTVAFHDINSSKPVHLLEPNISTTSSLCSNRSVGTTGSTSGGLTSLAFRSDGQHLALGNDCGLVHLYDLRKTGTGPVCTLDVRTKGAGSETGVKAVRFISSTPPSRVPSVRPPSVDQQLIEPSNTMMTDSMTSSSINDGTWSSNTVEEVPPHVRYRPNQYDRPNHSLPIPLPDHGARLPIPLPDHGGRYTVPNTVPSAKLAQNLFLNVDKQDIKDEYIETVMAPDNSERPEDMVETVRWDAGPREGKGYVAGVPSRVPNGSPLYESYSDPRPAWKCTKGRVPNGSPVSVPYSHWQRDRQGREEEYWKKRAEDKRWTDPRKVCCDTEIDDKVLGIDMDAVYDAVNNVQHGQDSSLSPKTSDSSLLKMNKNELREIIYLASKTTAEKKSLMINKNELKEVVEDAVDVLRENFTGSIQNLHRDFLRQFQRQADDTEKMFERQQTEIERLVKDNMVLREEREKNCRRF